MWQEWNEVDIGDQSLEQLTRASTLIHSTFLWLNHVYDYDYVMPGPVPENGDTAVNKTEENQDLYPCGTHFFGGGGLKTKLY